MFRLPRSALAAFAAVAAATIPLAGCTSPKEYVNNGFKVGPNYCRPDAPVADQWIERGDKRVHEASEDLSRWWAVFNDPVLDRLMAMAYQQNLSVRQAAYKVLEARAPLGNARGGLFPQQQSVNGGYHREGANLQFFDVWNTRLQPRLGA